MSAIPKYVYFRDAGQAATGLTPTFSSLVTSVNGTDKSGNAPTISEIGGGWYTFSVTFGTAPWDVITEELLAVVDGGVTLADVDRYKEVTITKADRVERQANNEVYLPD